MFLLKKQTLSFWYYVYTLHTGGCEGATTTTDASTSSGTIAIDASDATTAVPTGATNTATAVTDVNTTSAVVTDASTVVENTAITAVSTVSIIAPHVRSK